MSSSELPRPQSDTAGCNPPLGTSSAPKHLGQMPSSNSSTGIRPEYKSLSIDNLNAHNAASVQSQHNNIMLQKWLDDKDDRLVQSRVAEFWAELLQHDDLAAAIEAIVQNEEDAGHMQAAFEMLPELWRGDMKGDHEDEKEGNSNGEK